jgi:putative protease
MVRGELEIFVHGALCISYSGRCMLSNYLTARDANGGNCSHPCRFNYAVTEEKRPGQYFPIEEDTRGTYIFNAKDLCLLTLLPQLGAAGVNSLKIEGRMKSIFYVGGVVRIYRAALDYLRDLPHPVWQEPETIRLPELFSREIEKTGTRGISENFMKGKPTRDDMLYESSRAQQMVEPVAVIKAVGDRMLVEIRNRVDLGAEIEYMGPGLTNQSVCIVSMTTEQGVAITAANPGNTVVMATTPALVAPAVHGIMRRTRLEGDLQP